MKDNLCLLFNNKNIYLLFQGVEIVNDDTNKEIECEERSADDEDDEVEIIIERSLVLGLLINLCGINSVSHDLHPALECCLERKYFLCQNAVRLKLTTWKRARYACPTWSNVILELTQE